jgi:hypothetical protein
MTHASLCISDIFRDCSFQERNKFIPTPDLRMLINQTQAFVYHATSSFFRFSSFGFNIRNFLWETDRHTYTHKERERERERERLFVGDRHTYTHTHKERERERFFVGDRQTDRQTHTHKERERFLGETDRQTDRHTHTKRERERDFLWETDRQTHTHKTKRERNHQFQFCNVT